LPLIRELIFNFKLNLEQFSENENFQKNVSLQIEINKNEKINDEKMKNNLNKLHAQRSFWGTNNINVLCWAFYPVNDNKEVNILIPQTMHCIIYHNNPILYLNLKTQARKGLIIYNTNNSITALKKHVNLDHFDVF